MTDTRLRRALHAVRAFLASRLPDAEPAEFPPEAFAVPRWAQPASSIFTDVGMLLCNHERRYCFVLGTSVNVLNAIVSLPAIDELEPITESLDYVWVYLNRDYAIDRDCAEATYAALCAVIRAAAGERESQDTRTLPDVKE